VTKIERLEHERDERSEREKERETHRKMKNL
jgi:hypothetical protein